MTERDPRRDPQPGDVLEVGPVRITVTGRDKQVHYDLTSINPGPSPMDRIPMQCKCPIAGFRRVNRGATVVRRAPVIEAAEGTEG